METRFNKNIYILAPLSSKLDFYESNRLNYKIKELDSKIKFALDLSYVKECTIEFIENLVSISKEHEISIFNIPAELFVLFNVMNIDKKIKLFVSEIDFEENTRRLINRNFYVA